MAAPKTGKTKKMVLDDRQIEQLKTLSAMRCTLDEIEAMMGISKETLTRRFDDIMRDGRENGKVSVRRMMFAHGKKGNATALKYLCTNILKERIEELPERDGAQEIMEKLSSLSTDVILQIVKERSTKEG